MLEALKRFFCKQELKTFKIKVILPCTIVNDTLTFDRKNEAEYYTNAVDETEAIQNVIESEFCPYPHVCIDMVEEVSIS